jgi:RNA-directed DNA polymerase
VLEPIYERDFAAHRYGFRPRRGAKDALRRVNALLRAGYVHVVDADLRAYFDSIPRAALRARVETKVADGRVLALLDAFLQQPIFDGLQQTTSAAGVEMVRYADDFVVLCRTAENAQQALMMVQRWTQAAGLQLHPQKTRVVDVQQRGGFDFLGYHFERDHRWPRQKSRANLKDAVRAKTRRNHGHSLAVIIADVNRTLRGWFECFKHSHGSFKSEDAWVRTRLRAILRRRCGDGHHPNQCDHRRWPNAFFTAQGLFSLTQAHATLRQSLAR